MSRTLELLIKANDQASRPLQSIANTGKSSLNSLKNHAGKATMAISGLGAGLEGLARSQQEKTESTQRLANSIGKTEKEMRELAIATSDVTFPLEDVIDIMETGRQQGIKSAEQLQEYASFWDMVGDGAGENATQLAQAGTALNAIGIEATNQQEALGAFGYIAQETTSNVGDFLNFVERTGPELRDMGMNIDETAAIVGALESEFGMAGRTARSEFRAAVNESNGDMSVLLDTLGLSQEQLDQYTNKVRESSGVIEENAEIHAENYTLMQKFQHGVSELTYRYGDQIGAASDLSMIMMSMGPTYQMLAASNITLAGAKGVASTAAYGLGAAWRFMLGPIGWVIAGVGLLIGAITLLYKNWDSVTSFFSSSWDGIKNVFGAGIDFISGLFDLWLDRARKNFDIFVGALKGGWGMLTNIIKAPANMWISGMNSIINGLNNINIKVPNWVPMFGGNEFGFNIPNIPKFHTGGTFYSGNPSGEGMAMLRDGEKVLTPEQQKRQNNNQNNNQKVNINLILDGQLLGRIVGQELRDEMEIRLGGDM